MGTLFNTNILSHTFADTYHPSTSCIRYRAFNDVVLKVTSRGHSYAEVVLNMAVIWHVFIECGVKLVHSSSDSR